MSPTRLEPEWVGPWTRYTLPRLIYSGPQLTFREFGAVAPDEGSISYVYHLFTQEGDLLYVGLTAVPRKRWEQHARKAEWWHRAAYLNVYAVRGDDRLCADLGARHWEGLAIHEAYPLENRHGPGWLPYKQRQRQAGAS